MRRNDWSSSTVDIIALNTRERWRTFSSDTSLYAATNAVQDILVDGNVVLYWVEDHGAFSLKGYGI
jgi:hypothetical protein